MGQALITVASDADNRGKRRAARLPKKLLSMPS